MPASPALCKGADCFVQQLIEKDHSGDPDLARALGALTARCMDSVRHFPVTAEEANIIGCNLLVLPEDGAEGEE